MKPLKLTMTAFGPYKDQEVIDFRELGDNSLFVISGNTGAGKTTIFDGICFALYGSASGQDRENSAMLRSDFAEDDTHTAVELEFELHDRTYRILRQLGHVKQGNKTRTGEKYEFFETTGEKEIPCVDRQMISEIDKKVEMLMGLTQDQFKQIVMLPQGEFRKLLTSDTENKEDILRRLFKTEPYKQISERLRSKRDQVAETFNKEKQTQETYMQNILAALPEREESALFQTLADAHHNVHQVLDGLEKEVSFYKEQITADQEKYEQAYKAHGEKQTVFHAAKALNERFGELEEKEKLLQKLTDQTPSFKEKEDKLADAERAQRIEPYEKQAKETKEEEKEKNSAFHDAEKTKQTAEETYGNAATAYQEQENKQNEREQVSRKLDRLKEYLPTVKEMDEREKRLRGLANEKQTAEKALQSARSELQDKKQQAEKLRAEMKEKEEAVGQLPEKENELIAMREKWKVLDDYHKLKADEKELAQTYKARKQALQQQKERYTSLEEAWLNNQAYVLATHLHGGEACPVCGSHDHPKKATDQMEDAVTKEQLETAKAEFNEVDVAYRNAAASLHAKTEQRKQQEKEVTTYDILPEEARSRLEQLKEQGKQLRAEKDKLQAASDQLILLKKQFEQLNEAGAKLEEATEKRKTSYDGLATTFAAEQAVYRDRLQNIPEEVRKLPALEQQIKETDKLKVKMAQDLEMARKQYEQAKEARTKATSGLEYAQKQLGEAKARRERAGEQFTGAFTGADFASEAAYEQAKLTDEGQAALKQQIEQFKQQLSTTKQQVQELKDALKDKQKADLTAIEKQLDELKQAYEAALNKRDASNSYHEQTTAFVKHISETSEKVRTAEKELETINDLYDVVRGQNSKKISFERYLQISYLEQIIEAANHRLRRLSNGQFVLMRSDRQEARGRQSGLGLDVHDAYTGQTRDVKTLSGGEKFNASLCLALGMSDVIQSFQGNISIKTMFIDEGFGSLDEESLNKSIETLIDLQKSGRMIGVISHVQELKAIFPAVLEVKKTKEGYSQTQFHGVGSVVN